MTQVQDSHTETRELTPTSCPLTSKSTLTTRMLTCMHTHTHTINARLKILEIHMQLKFFKFEKLLFK